MGGKKGREDGEVKNEDGTNEREGDVPFSIRKDGTSIEHKHSRCSIDPGNVLGCILPATLAPFFQ